MSSPHGQKKRRRTVLDSCRGDRRDGWKKLARALYFVLTIVACVPQVVRSWRTEQTVQDLVQRIAQMEEHRISSSSVSRLQLVFRSIKMNGAVRTTLPQTGDLVEHGDWHMGTCRGYHVNPSVRASRLATCSTRMRLERSFLGQPLMKWRRAKLDPGAAGLYVFSLVSECGDQQPTTNRSGSRSGGVACTVWNKDAGTHVPI